MNNQKYTDNFKLAIQMKLNEIAARDQGFYTKYHNPKKNIDDCITYILNTVQKSGVLFTSFVDGKKAETIEVDLTGKVQQSRGHCNNLTEHHEKIVSLVEEALPKLLKRKIKTT